MAFTRSITTNILSNGAGFAVSAFVALALAPFVRDQLGNVGYGAWILIVALTGYYGLLDLGVRGAVGLYMTRYVTKADMAGVNRTVSTAAVVLSVVALIILALSLILAHYAADLLRLREDLSTEGISKDHWGRVVDDAYWVILIIGLNVALTLPLSVFGAATFARQRFDLANGVSIVERLVFAGLTLWVLSSGGGMIGLALVTTGTNLAAAGLRVFIAYKLLAGLSVSLRHASLSSFTELRRFGVAAFMSNIADRIIYHTDVFVIGLWFAWPASGLLITHYEFSSKLIPFLVGLVNAVAWTLTPYAAARDTEGNRDALQRLCMKGTRGMFILTGFLGGGLLFLGSDFLALWAGMEHVTGKGILQERQVLSGSTILILLSISTVLRCNMSVCRQILFGMREVKFVALVSLSEAGLNLLLSLLLIPAYGLLGIVLGTLIPSLLFQLVLVPSFLLRRLEIDASVFLRSTLTGGLVVLGLMAALFVLLDPLLEASTWSVFLLKCALVGTPALVLGLLAGTSTEERRAFRDQLWRRGPDASGSQDC